MVLNSYITTIFGKTEVGIRLTDCSFKSWESSMWFSHVSCHSQVEAASFNYKWTISRRPGRRGIPKFKGRSQPRVLRCLFSFLPVPVSPSRCVSGENRTSPLVTPSKAYTNGAAAGRGEQPAPRGGGEEPKVRTGDWGK